MKETLKKPALTLVFRTVEDRDTFKRLCRERDNLSMTQKILVWVKRYNSGEAI